MNAIKNFIFLVIFVVLAFLGVRFCCYGLFVSFVGGDLVTLSMDEVTPENVKYNRYIKITDAYSINAPLEYIGEGGKINSYLYILLKKGVHENSITSLKSNIVLESKKEIKDWTNKKVEGILKPHWYYIDQEVINGYQVAGFEIDKNGYYLVADEKPWKWYYYMLILLVACLFLYRLGEAIVKGLRKHGKSKEEKTEDSLF